MNDFDHILDECLTQISSGASTLDECLVRHPVHAAQLKPFLQTASRLERGREIQPSPAFKARARAGLTLHMQAHPRRKPAASPFLRLAFGLAALVLACLTAGTAFAQGALPGDILYDWKVTSEQAWRAVASDPLEADLFLLGRRADELVAVSGDAARSPQALVAYQKALTRLTVEAGADSQARILPVLVSQQETFMRAGISIPELDAAIDVNESILPAPTPLPVLPFAPTALPSTASTLIPTLIPTFVPTVVIPTDILPTLIVPTPPVTLP